MLMIESSRKSFGFTGTKLMLFQIFTSVNAPRYPVSDVSHSLFSGTVWKYCTLTLAFVSHSGQVTV